MSNIRPALVTAAIASLAAVVVRPAAQESTASRVPNLLSFASGTIVRAYTKSITAVEHVADGDADASGNEPGLADATTGPLQIVYELPGVATLSSVTVTLDRVTDTAIAVSVASASTGFQEVGRTKSSGSVGGVSGARARWVRVTTSAVDGTLPIKKLAATGTIAARPASAPAPSGDFWALDDTINDAGSVRSAPSAADAHHLEVNQIDDGINAIECANDGYSQTFPGTLAGRTWSFLSASCAGGCNEIEKKDAAGHFVVNDEGTLIVGVARNANGNPQMRAFMRAPGRPLPTYCVPQQTGKGATKVLVMQSTAWDGSYPFPDAGAIATRFKEFGFQAIGAGALTPALLHGADIVLFLGLCRPELTFNAQQIAATMDWVRAGHKLLVQDSDMCNEGTNHAFSPYPFDTSNPGAQGKAGHTLLFVENDSLGSADRNDADHFVDVAAYANEPANDLGDAGTVKTQDARWCGHLFGINSEGVNGFMQMYTVYGKGLIIYDGLDKDDAGIAQHQALRRLEYLQTVPGDLPCSHRVSSGLVLAPDAERTFEPGKAQTITVPLQALSNNGWQGRVTLTAAGDFPATLSPAALNVPPLGAAVVTVTIAVPAAAKPGKYAVTVKGAGPGGQSAQAVVSLRNAETRDLLRAELAKSCKVALYGINFDFDKATIRKDAEPALQQVRALFSADPSLTVEIGGHTDNVGTAAYNATLSAGRAAAVKAWLVAHGVDGSRLTTHGYGDTVPVAPNTSDENRAKNRRVELKKPNCTEQPASGAPR